MTDHVAGERALKARFRAAAGAQGLSLEAWGFDPDDTGTVGADVVNVVLVADEAALTVPVSTLAADADFARVIQSTEAAAAQAAAGATRSTLSRRLSQGGSILDPLEKDRLP